MKVFIAIIITLTIAIDASANNATPLEAKLQEFNALMNEMNSPSKQPKNVYETNDEIAIIYKKFISILRELLELGLDPNYVLTVKDGKLAMPASPLILALGFEDYTLARDLISRGAKVDQIFSEGTPLLTLIADRPGKSPDFEFTQEHYALLEKLLKKGADKIVNYQDRMGYTALHHIARYIKGTIPAQMAQLLIDYGADVNIKNNNGLTPLHNAARKRNIDVAQVLIKNNADINSTDKRGEAPIAFLIDALELPNAQTFFKLLVCKDARVDTNTSFFTETSKDKDFNEYRARVKQQVQKLLEDFSNDRQAFCAEFAE